VGTKASSRKAKKATTRFQNSLLILAALFASASFETGSTMAQDNKPPVGNTMGDVIGNQGIITQGQIGNNYLFQFIPPTIKIVSQLPPRKLDDGTYEVVVIFRLESQAQANSLLVAIVKEDIIVTPGPLGGFRLTMNGGGAMMVRSGEEQGYVWTKIQTPAKGEWVVGARIATPEAKPRIKIQVD
jgi:hypothetical protein